MQVGRYQLFETLGVGATSVWYALRSDDWPCRGRQTFPAEIAQGAARERFCAKHGWLANFPTKISSPYTTWGIEESSQTPYLVMEFVEGLPLDAFWKKAQFPWLERALGWPKQQKRSASLTIAA